MKRAVFLLLILCLAGCSIAPAYWLPPSGPASGRVDFLYPTAVETVVPLPQDPARADVTPDATAQWIDRRPETGLTAVPSGEPQAGDLPILYYAQAADTLPVLAHRFGVEPGEINFCRSHPQNGLPDSRAIVVYPCSSGRDNLGRATAAR